MIKDTAIVFFLFTCMLLAFAAGRTLQDAPVENTHKICRIYQSDATHEMQCEIVGNYANVNYNNNVN